jgi:rubrerythrin
MDRMATIELALKNEKQEMAYYQAEAKRSRNPLAQAMFENLAADEHEHMIRIQRLHDRLVSEGAWPQDVPIEVAGTHIQETLAANATKAATKADHDDDDEQAIEKAIAFEGAGERLYRALAEEATNAQEKTFFAFLAGIEREHRLSLVDSLAYLKDPSAWLEQHERISLDGA